MRKAMQTIVAMAAAAATLASVGVAGATSSANGVFFVHGTGDYTKPTSPLNPTTGSAVTDYWMKFSIDKIRTHPDGTKWNYGVAGYQGASTDAMTSYAEVGKQIFEFYRSYGPLLNIVVVTHSNGSNPMRYLLAHPTAQIWDKGANSGAGGYVCAAKLTGGTCNGVTYGGIVKRVVMVAADNAGTPLADKVTSSGTIASIGNSILSFFGGSSWNNPAVRQQIQANMTTYNGNGTFATNSNPGAVSAQYIYGSRVYATMTSSDAQCGYDRNKADCVASCAWYDAICWGKQAACRAEASATTLGLKAAAYYGWDSFDAATDGFIGTNSSTYFGTDPNGYGGDARLNHNQSRRSCHGSDTRIAAYVHGAMGNTFDTIPPDYVVDAPAQACNATVSGWQSASPYAGNFYWAGCTSSMKSDANTDYNCQIAYGGDNGNVLPASDYPATSSAYFNSSYYSSGGCSDSWLGDGECDLCLLAKYGYDAAPGDTAHDDCVNKGTSTANRCADLAYYDQAGSIGYYSYTATH